MNGTGNREAKRCDVDDASAAVRSHRGQGESAKFDMREDNCLKLILNGFCGKEFRGSEMAAAGIVDYNIEVSRFMQRDIETLA